MSENGEFFKKLLTLLTLFRDRPYHLTKYLMENSALTPDFKKKVLTLRNDLNQNIHFKSISEMNNFYNSLIYDENIKTKEEIEIELNDKLRRLIEDERYEDAASLRDYMKSRGFKKY